MNPIGKPRCISALLENDRVAIGTAQLLPANACHFAVWPCAGRHRLVGHQRLVRAKVAIGKPKQRPLSLQEIDSISGTWLRDTIATASRIELKIELKGSVGSVLVSSESRISQECIGS